MAEEEDKPKTRRSAAPRKTSTARRKPAAKAAATETAAKTAASSTASGADDRAEAAEAVTLAEPAKEERPASGAPAADAESPIDRVPWKRGLTMLAFLVMIWVGQWLLGLATVIQFLWMAVTGERNRQIATFGEGLGDWLNRAARFQTGATEDKPFPWRRWGA